MAAGSRNRPDRDYADYLIRYLNLCLASRNPERFLRTVPDLPGALSEIGEARILRIARLAEKHGQPAIFADALRGLLIRPRLGWAAADYIMQIGASIGDDDLHAPLERYLLRRIPRAQQRLFRIEAAFRRDGPLAALALARSLPPMSRGAAEAAQLARILLASGGARLANRYLRLCYRRWQGAPMFRDLLFSSYLQCGLPAAAERFLDDMRGTQPARVVARLRVRLMIEKGDLAAAAGEMRRPGGRSLLKAKLWLRVCLSLGLLDEAESLLPAMHAERQGQPRATAHFGVTQLGTMLNELRLYKKTAGAGAAHHAFFCAAREVVTDWAGRQPARAAKGRSPIPRRIFQYWDSPEPPPAIAQIMASWQGHRGFAYNRMDRAAAIRFLRDRFGPHHVKAFRFANRVAEECDFLRLCVLYAEGGLYADADDMLIDTPRALLTGKSGAILFQEPFGSIANNQLWARPEHPVIEIAMKMALQALLARDNDNTWSKTGPGLITRAVAAYLAATPRPAACRELLILPKWRMHPLVRPHLELPYKSMPGYWNALGGTAPRPVADVLAETVARRPRRGARQRRAAAGGGGRDAH